MIRLISGAIMSGFDLRAAIKTFPEPGGWRAVSAILCGLVSPIPISPFPAGTGRDHPVRAGPDHHAELGPGCGVKRLSGLQWAGFVLAAGGALVWLVSPSIEAPPLAGDALAMAVAGIGWGAIPCRAARRRPTAATAGNFVRATADFAVPCFGIALLIAPEPVPPSDGIALAIISGAITSGLGYVDLVCGAKGLTATPRRDCATYGASHRGDWRRALSGRADHGAISLATLAILAASRSPS